MRSQAMSGNALMESMHLAQYSHEGARQQQAVLAGMLRDRQRKVADQGTFRAAQTGKMASARSDKAQKLNRDDAVHAALLKRKVRVCVCASVCVVERGVGRAGGWHFLSARPLMACMAGGGPVAAWAAGRGLATGCELLGRLGGCRQRAWMRSMAGWLNSKGQGAGQPSWSLAAFWAPPAGPPP